ncbi:MAG: zinc metalloprotease HtpX [Candidatus Thermoplasmatota archaeon]|nr:zinc metalloprotease HtpX [Candidatus Thermoplasmatota archaeon]
MASLIALKRDMSLTMILVFGLLFAIVMLIALFVNFPLLPGMDTMTSSLIWGGAIVGLFILIQWAISGSIVAWSSRLRYLKEGENKWLEKTVKELAEDAEVPMPRLAVVNDPTPNAFVFGRTLKSASLAVHTGLLQNLNKDEVKAVLAHEMGHLKHRDVIIMTVASVIPLVCFVGARALLWGSIMSGGSRRNNNGGAIILLGILLMAIYVVSQLLVLRLSRMREFYADAYSAQSTRNPHALASALAKITYGLSMAKKDNPSAVRSFYIGDPESARREIGYIMAKKSEYDLDGNGVLDQRELQLAMESEAKKNKYAGAISLFSTHPPTFKRIMNLLEMEKEIGR